jgi:hypothetical protein
LEPPHLLPLGGQDCNRLLLPTLWLQVEVVAVEHGQVVVVLAVLEQAHYL